MLEPFELKNALIGFRAGETFLTGAAALAKAVRAKFNLLLIHSDPCLSSFEQMTGVQLDTFANPNEIGRAFTLRRHPAAVFRRHQ